MTGVKVISVSSRFRVSRGSQWALVALLGVSSQAAAQEPGASEPAPVSEEVPAAPVTEGTEAPAPAPDAAVTPADGAAAGVMPDAASAPASVLPDAAGAPAAVPPAAPAPPLSEPPSSVQDQGEAKKPRIFGAMFDLGVPDGTNLSFVYRPVDIARFHAGLGYNGVSPGLRIGGEYIPLGWGPTIGLAYGHFFEGDASGLAGDVDDKTKPMLQEVGYSFFALRAGMEFGGDRFTFFGRGGVTWVSSTLHHIDDLMQPDPGSNTTVSIEQDPTLKAFMPTLQLGMIVQI